MCSDRSSGPPLPRSRRFRLRSTHTGSATCSAAGAAEDRAGPTDGDRRGPGGAGRDAGSRRPGSEARREGAGETREAEARAREGHAGREAEGRRLPWCASRTTATAFRSPRSLRLPPVTRSTATCSRSPASGCCSSRSAAQSCSSPRVAAAGARAALWILLVLVVCPVGCSGGSAVRPDADVARRHQRTPTAGTRADVTISWQ